MTEIGPEIEVETVSAPPEEEADGRSVLGGVVGGVFTGLGVLVAAIGVYAFRELWGATDSLYDDGGFNSGDPTDFGGAYADIQRWTSVSLAMIVIGAGLVLMALGFVIRRLDR